jgi:three-Cys-motif partner protein
VAEPKTTVWQIEPQTAAKHALLRRYLGAWFPKLGKFNGRLLFYDGFAGPGRYTDGEIGSPLIALETLMGHRHLPALKTCEFLFLFNEEDQARASQLESEIEARYPASALPSNVKVQVVCDEFDATTRELVALGEEQGKQLAPTFAFVDPFGFKGMSIDLLRRLLKSPKCELFILFSFNSLNRWITHPNEQIQNHLYDLFGTIDYEDAADLKGQQRKAFLVNLYEEQIRKIVGLEHVRGIEMVTKEGNSYFLIYGTRHLSGLRAMKEAMWKLDPSGSYVFNSKDSGQQLLFPAEPDTSKEQEQVKKHFAGQTVAPWQVDDYVVEHTRLASNHVRKLILKPLQARGEIAVANQGRAGTFPDRVLITF